MMMCISNTKHRILLFAVAVLATLPLACNSPAAQPTQAPAAKATVVPTAAPTVAPTVAPTKPAAQPTTASAAVTPTAKPGGLAGALGQFASPDALNSYRSKMTMGEVKANGTKSPLTSWTIEWAKEGPSTHMVMGSAGAAIETIKIGDKTWMNLMGSWIQAPTSTTTRTDTTQSPDSFLPQQDISVKQVGTETVNGIPCKKFTYTGKVTINIADPGKPANNVTWDMAGEIWVADKAGLPPVAVKQTAQWKGTMFAALLGAGTPGPAAESTYYMDVELSDLNTPITIKAPEGASQLPAIPGLPGGIPTRPSGIPTGPTPVASLNDCTDYVPDPASGDPADAATQRVAAALAAAAYLGQPTLLRAYVTEDALEDVKAYYAEELPAWDWTQTGTGALAPGGWDTSWKQAEYVLRVLLLAPTTADPTTKIVVVCSFAK